MVIFEEVPGVTEKKINFHTGKQNIKLVLCIGKYIYIYMCVYKEHTF